MTRGENEYKLRRKDKAVLEKIFAKIRQGQSLYAACLAVGISTNEFYHFLALEDRVRGEFFMALSDYADKCTDDIRVLVENLKAGEIDNSTAKLLIETMKWLAQKACPEPMAVTETEAAEKFAEIEIKFVS